MRSSILLIVISIFILSCKTITLDDEQVIADIPNDLEFIIIPAGAYTPAEGGGVKYIEYDYMMMKYPVTNAQYIEYLKEAFENGDINITSQGVTEYYKGDKYWPAGKYEFVYFYDPDSRIAFNPPDDYMIKYNWFGGRIEGYDNHPVTEVTWFGANAFAEYYGMRLPTKEEWVKAAGANSKNKYAWGNTISPSYANYRDSGDEYDNGTTPVGYYNGSGNTKNSYSPYGIYDMAGNVWEWTSSWKDQSPGKVLKGGSWNSNLGVDMDTGEMVAHDFLIWVEPTYGYSPNNSNSEIGFRCVKIFE